MTITVSERSINEPFVPQVNMFSRGRDGLGVESLTPKREVGVRYLPLPCCVIKQRRIYSPKSTGNIQEAVAPC